MSTIEHSVDVMVPVRTAYDQWTQVESFPEFMGGVESVKQLTETRSAWVAEVAGVRREFEAEITEQHPDERVAWRSVGEPRQAGVVTFHRLDEGRTRVTLQMEYDPKGFVETAGDWLQLVRMRVRHDLELFKRFMESRGSATGGWRGEVPGPHQRGSATGEEAMPPGVVGGEPTPSSPDLSPPAPGPMSPAPDPRAAPGSVRPEDPPPPRPVL